MMSFDDVLIGGAVAVIDGTTTSSRFLKNYHFLKQQIVN